MASLRSTVMIGRSAEDTWAVVRDSGSLPTWFLSIESCSVIGDMRECVLRRGGRVRERIVTVNDSLRRFQYSVVEGLPVSSHLGTVDVIETGVDQCLVVYSTEAEPDDVAEQLGQAVVRGLAELRSHLEEVEAWRSPEPAATPRVNG